MLVTGVLGGGDARRHRGASRDVVIVGRSKADYGIIARWVNLGDEGAMVRALQFGDLYKSAWSWARFPPSLLVAASAPMLAQPPTTRSPDPSQ